MNMTAKFLAALLNDKLSTVEVQFKGCDGQGMGQGYTFKTTLELAKGDEVIVDSPSTGMTVVVVKEVHETPQLDENAPFEYKWIVSKVDREAHDARIAEEESLIKEFAIVERKQKQLNAVKALKQSMGVAFDDECPEIDALINRLSSL